MPATIRSPAHTTSTKLGTEVASPQVHPVEQVFPYHILLFFHQAHAEQTNEQANNEPNADIFK